MRTASAAPLAATAGAIPATGAWPTFQAWAVDGLKRWALRLLHRSARGTAWVLQRYLWAEQQGEASGVAELERLAAPDWLQQQMRSHLDDERRHVRMLEAVLQPRLGEPPARLDPLTRHKLRRMRRVVQDSAGFFAAGAVVPQVAMGAVMEAMGVRFMARHVDVLRELVAACPVGPRPAATHCLAVLQRILADERRHVAMFEGALGRLIGAGEEADLERLRRRLEAIDRSFGITSAIGLLAASLVAGRP